MCLILGESLRPNKWQKCQYSKVSRHPPSRRRVCAVSAVTGQPGTEMVLRSARGRIALAATVAASSMAFLDSTVVNVALPHIGGDFHVGVSSLQWVLTGYMLSLASLILLGGTLGDHFGRRKLFVIGTVWFAGASLL